MSWLKETSHFLALVALYFDGATEITTIASVQEINIDKDNRLSKSCHAQLYEPLKEGDSIRDPPLFGC